ncbi:MAG TPA: hypothetical protein VF722_00950 [Gemmatimonadaceae bacterium]|jgi:hypothetical protein
MPSSSDCSLKSYVAFWSDLNLNIIRCLFASVAQVRNRRKLSASTLDFDRWHEAACPHASMIADTDSEPDAELIEQYIALEQSRDCDAEESWPVDALRRIVPDEPDRAWRILTSLISRSPEALLPRIGVRELEEFVALHALDFISQIESHARADRRFRLALGNVWISHGAFPSEIEQRLIAASNGTMTLLRHD